METDQHLPVSKTRPHPQSMRLLAAILLLIPSRIVRRADVADEKYVELGARYPAVIALGRAGDGTLIDRQWLITAAHVARALERSTSRPTVHIGSRDYVADRIVVHPAWRDLGPHDIGLIHLATPVSGVEPLGLYRRSAERGAVAILVGHGATGVGSSRNRIDDGKRRGATSKVDSVTNAWLYFSFDAPPGGTAVEGAPGAGDSGGPAILSDRGASRVAGISSAGFDGRYGPGTYGARDAFTRVSTHVAWIDSVMKSKHSKESSPASKPAPSSRALPSTAIGRRYSAFLDAVKANTDAAMARFVDENFDKRESSSRPALVPNLRRIAGMLQGASIEEVVSASASELAVRFRTSSGRLTLALVCDAGPSCLLTDWRRYD
jgi:hypothetical protein